MSISPKRPAPTVGQRAKHGLSRAVNAALRFDQLHSLLEASTGDFRKSLGNCWILKCKIINAIACDPLPARDPIAAEIAITIEDQQRLGWRRTDPHYIHRACLRLIAAPVEAHSIQLGQPTGPRVSRPAAVPSPSN